jgi:hypothetical protein
VAGTWVVIGFAALHLAVTIPVATVTLDLSSTAGPASISPARLALALTIVLAYPLTLAGAVISLVIWNRRTRRLAEQYGFDGSLVVRHWLLRAYGATAIATVFLPPLLDIGDSASTVLVTAIRVGAGLLLLGSVLTSRARLLRLIADSARQSQLARTPSVEPAPGTPAPSEPELDDRWNRVGQ